MIVFSKKEHQDSLWRVGSIRHLVRLLRSAFYSLIFTHFINVHYFPCIHLFPSISEKPEVWFFGVLLDIA